MGLPNVSFNPLRNTLPVDELKKLFLSCLYIGLFLKINTQESHTVYSVTFLN